MSRRVAIVTGAAGDIGRACAVALAKSGHDLVLSDIDAARAGALSGSMQAHAARSTFVAADIADLGSHAVIIDTAFETFGRLDCLVNVAGIASPVRGDLLDLAPENFDRVIDVNLRGTMFLGHLAARAMMARGTDPTRAIITVTSVSADLASPERVDYCVSKAGLSMWVKALALRLAGEGIGVFEVRPGIIRSAMTAAVAGKYDRLIAEGLVPAGRWGAPEDVGAAVADLASGRFAFATGSVVNVDGALSVPRL